MTLFTNRTYIQGVLYNILLNVSLYLLLCVYSSTKFSYINVSKYNLAYM